MAELKNYLLTKKLPFCVLIFISVVLLSCSNDYKDVSKSEFITKILPTVEVEKVTIKNNEEVLVETEANEHYRIELGSVGQANSFINELDSVDDNFKVIYDHSSPGTEITLIFWQTLSLIIPLLMLAHIVLLLVAIRKILKSGTENSEKILNTIISIFIPFFGPIIYLTNKKQA